MSDLDGISEALSRIDTDVEKVHRPRLEAAKEEIDAFFDEAEARVDEFFAVFVNASNTVIDSADQVIEVSRSALDIVSTNADRSVSSLEEANDRIVAESEKFGEELEAVAALSASAIEQTDTAAQTIQSFWATALEEADRFMADAQASVQTLIAGAAQVDDVEATVEQSYNQTILEAGNAVSEGLNGAQEILEKLKSANANRKDLLEASLTEQLDLNVQELTRFIETISGGFGQ